MQTIPEIRERMRELANQLQLRLNTEPQLMEIGRELRELADATKRRPMVRKRASARQEFTEEKRMEIMQYAQQFPSESYHEIARALNVNTARISETLNPA